MKKSIPSRKKLLDKCGLPDVPETSHCFSDSTHHTCCLLGSKAREYADASSNPIGALSVRVQSIHSKAKGMKTVTAMPNNLVPWCTCTGSKVCSYYSSKFGNVDGTRIKFIGNLKPNKSIKSKTNNKNTKKGRNNKTLKNNTSNASNASRKLWNEDKAIVQLDLLRHRTPGVK